MMQPEYENYDHLEPVPGCYSYSFVLVVFLALQSLRVFVKRYATPTSVAEQDRWKWQNIQISWCHSTITGLGSLYCFYNYPELSQDMVAFHNPTSYAIAAFSTGYFFSDFVDIVSNFRRKILWEILLHHIAGLLLLVYNISSCRYIGYTIAALLAEVHSISLHLRKLMQMAGVSFQNPFYILNNVLNFILFITFRFVAITWITFGMFWDRDRVSTTYFCLLCFTLLAIWGINIVLLWRLIKNDILRNLNPAESTGDGKDAHSSRSNAENNNRGKYKAM